MKTKNYQFYPMANAEIGIYGRFGYFGIGIGFGYYHWMSENLDRFSITLPIELIFPVGNGLSFGASAITSFPIGKDADTTGILDADLSLSACLRYDF